MKYLALLIGLCCGAIVTYQHIAIQNTYSHDAVVKIYACGRMGGEYARNKLTDTPVCIVGEDVYEINN